MTKSSKIKTHIRRESWMTEPKYSRPSVCTTLYKYGDYDFASPREATCGSCLRIWLWEAWSTGRLKETVAS